MRADYKARRTAKHAAERVITSAELAAAHASAPNDYKRGGSIVWQRGTTDALTCQLLVCFVLWNQPRARWFKASPKATTLTFPSVKTNGTVVCTLDPQAYSTLLNDTIGQQHFNDSILEHKVKGWMQTHQPGEPALLCTFTCGCSEALREEVPTEPELATAASDIKEPGITGITGTFGQGGQGL